MPELFDFKQGNSPLLISSPHDGADFAGEIKAKLTPVALSNVDRDCM